MCTQRHMQENEFQLSQLCNFSENHKLPRSFYNLVVCNTFSDSLCFQKEGNTARIPDNPFHPS